MGSKETPHEAVMHLNDLMQLLDAHDHLNVFLLAGSTNKAIVSILSRYYENNPERFKRIVICSRSPIIIYQVRIEVIPSTKKSTEFLLHSITL